MTYDIFDIVYLAVSNLFYSVFRYLVNKLEIQWLYPSLNEKKK